MKRIVPIIVMLAVLIVSGLAMQKLKGGEVVEADPVHVEARVDSAAVVTFKKEFEVVLNSFLKDVATNARAYKKQRKVLEDLIQPVNLRNSEYISENYEMMELLVVDLQVHMDALMSVFVRADEQINALLHDQSESMKVEVRSQWTALKAQHAGRYVEFFTFEQQSLQTYRALMGLYYQKQNFLHVDLALDKVIFNDEDDTQEEQVLLRELVRISKERAMVLRKR